MHVLADVARAQERGEAPLSRHELTWTPSRAITALVGTLDRAPRSIVTRSSAKSGTKVSAASVRS